MYHILPVGEIEDVVFGDLLAKAPGPGPLLRWQIISLQTGYTVVSWRPTTCYDTGLSLSLIRFLRQRDCPATMDDLNLDLPKLKEDEWETIAELAHYTGNSIVSFETLQSAHPAGSVALILAAKHRQKEHHATLILTPKSKTALDYLMRIDFPRLARRYSVLFDRPQQRLEQLYRQDRDRFTEILQVGAPRAKRVFDQVKDYYRNRFRGHFARAWSTFEQVFSNIEDHTASSGERPALNIIQVQGYQQHLEVAFGDLGMGFLKSLKRNPAHTTVVSEQEALSRVILDEESGLGHQNKNRGGGLRKALDAIQKLGGSFRLVSGDGVAFRGARKHENFQFTAMQPSFPGTIMAVWIPFPTQNSTD